MTINHVVAVLRLYRVTLKARAWAAHGSGDTPGAQAHWQGVGDVTAIIEYLRGHA